MAGVKWAYAFAAVTAIAILIFGDQDDHYVFIVIYLAAAVYALAHRHMLAFATAVMVAIVRAMVAADIGGFLFQLASLIFAIMFFMLIVLTIREGTPKTIAIKRD
jgi:hypothetical protein